MGIQQREPLPDDAAALFQKLTADLTDNNIDSNGMMTLNSFKTLAQGSTLFNKQGNGSTTELSIRI